MFFPKMHLREQSEAAVGGHSHALPKAGLRINGSLKSSIERNVVRCGGLRDTIHRCEAQGA
jgi:hypothetical protein